MFKFKLVALSGNKFDGEVHEVILPTLDGQIGVLAHHMPLVSVVAPGVIYVRKTPKDTDRDRDFYAVSGGVIDVSHNVLRVLVDEADHADTINQAEAEAAHERAQKMKAEAKDQVSLEHATSMVERTGARLQVANLKRRHRK